ncbi:MAG: hypothetical protein ABH862_03195 [Candidatus Omnitrophota bacterium]
MKYIKTTFLIVLVFLITHNAEADQKTYSEIKQTKFTIRKEGQKIIIKQNERIYEYPTSSKEYDGIKKVEKADLNGDGIEEYIISAQFPEQEMFYPDGKMVELSMTVRGMTIICEDWGESLSMVSKMIPGNVWPSFKILDVDGDGLNDVMAMGYTYGQWQQLQIVSWKDGKYVYLWQQGGGKYTTEQTYSVNEEGKPQIKVGYPTSIQTGAKQQYVVDEWVTWIWDGTRFSIAERDEKDD